jgi:hypothetical protein
MIHIKNSQLNNESISALSELIEMDIKASIAFKLMRIIKEVSSLVEDKIKSEKKILDKYLERDSSGNPIPAVDESGMIVEGAYKVTNVDSFNKEMYDLMEIINTIGYDPINFDDLNLSTAKVKDLMKIEFLFL